MINAITTVKQIFANFNSKGIEYAILGGYTSIEEVEHSKCIEVFIRKSYIQPADEIFRDSGWFSPKLNTARYSRRQYIKLTTEKIYKFNIVSGLDFGHKLLKYRYEDFVFEKVREVNEIRILHPITALTLFLLHIIYDREMLSEKEYNRLKLLYDDFASQDDTNVKIEDTFRNCLKPIIEEMLIGKSSDINLKMDNYKQIIEKQEMLKYDAIYSYRRDFATHTNCIVMKWLNKLGPKTVNIIGVDGTGKTSTVNDIKKILGDKANVQYMGFNNYETGLAQKYCGDGNELGKFKLIMAIMRTWALYNEMWYRYLKYRFDKHITIYDRCVSEAYINASGKARLLYKVLFVWCFPKPVQIYYLHCSVESSLNRKNDIIEPQIFIKNKELFDHIYLNDPKVLSLSTDMMSQSEIVELIIEDLNKKYAKYFI